MRTAIACLFAFMAAMAAGGNCAYREEVPMGAAFLLIVMIVAIVLSAWTSFQEEESC